MTEQARHALVGDAARWLCRKGSRPVHGEARVDLAKRGQAGPVGSALARVAARLKPGEAE